MTTWTNARWGTGQRVATMPLDDVVLCAVDLETTGVRGRDRVIEVGLVRATADGTVLAEYDTLIDPQRTASDSRHVHGISDGALVGAPPFEEVAGDIAELLDQAVLVAHNAPFDRRFLNHEFARLGETVEHLPFICTMQLSSLWGDPPTRRLNDCCEYYGVDQGTAHRALTDAHACLGLLTGALTGRSCLAELGVAAGESWTLPLPAAPTHLRGSGRRHRREDAVASTVPGQRGTGAAPESVVAYRRLLDEVLADRRIDAGEHEALERLGRETVSRQRRQPKRPPRTFVISPTRCTPMTSSAAQSNATSSASPRCWVSTPPLPMRCSGRPERPR